MSIADKLTAIAQNCESIYSRGFNEGFAEGSVMAGENLYSAITLDGKRTIYTDAFSRTNYEFIGVPFPEPITPTSRIDRMFYIYYGASLPWVDLSKVPTNVSCQSLFSRSKLKTIPDLGLPAMNSYLNVFRNCADLVTVRCLRVKQRTTFQATFEGCSSLQNITFEGEIGQNISFSGCPELTKASIVNMFDKLTVYSSGSHTVTLHPTALGRLSTSDIAIATSKKWTVTSA